MLKPLLVEVLSKEQLGFLKNRQIMEVVGTTQELLHSIKIKIVEALVLKMDLIIKSCNQVNWVFLRLILL